MKVLIIGGVAAGMSAAARLRRLDEKAEITVYEMSENVSYANCGLPYFVSDVISNRDHLLLQNPTALWNRFRIKAKVQHMVTAIDRVNKKNTGFSPIPSCPHDLIPKICGINTTINPALKLQLERFAGL